VDSLVSACLQSPSSVLQTVVLRQIVARPLLHARWLNTLSRLEYVGVRKMLKVRRSDALDLSGLRHVLEEAAHATRLKKAAVSLASDEGLVATFSEAHTLCGDAAERYFQSLDCSAASQLALRGVDNAEACYWLTSAAIEIRARSFYPAYQAVLDETGSSVSVLSIIGDEQEHLAQMASELPKYVNPWREALTHVMCTEEREFTAYLEQVSALVGEL
jgi:hypothetical protein